jgi:hypothetical protein
VVTKEKISTGCGKIMCTNNVGETVLIITTTTTTTIIIIIIIIMFV